MDGGGTCTGTPVTACSGGSSGSGILMPLSPGFKRVRIHNGTIRGYGTAGILLNGPASGSELEDLVVRDNGSIAAAILLDDVEPGGTIVVRRLHVTRNRSDGLRPDTGAGNNPFRLVIEGSVFSANGNAGVQTLAGARIVDSSFLGNANWGLVCPSPCALGRSVFVDNKVGTPNQEWAISGLRDMGGNVCGDGTCP
jgi:hypothetical protein